MTLGDIIELEEDGKKVYLQYVKEAENETLLEKMRVFYRVYDERPIDIYSIIKDDFFFLDFPYRYGIKDKGVNLIGNIPLSLDFTIPKRYRTENVFGSGWRIINEGDKSEVVEELSDEQKKFSPYGMWSIPEIFENLKDGWRLENWI
ncbi:hypothetical protein [Flagellimonas okinawensis]|uniref:Immunity protein 26 n=1 Tax=Flagellimonas okinawensis TaxID=3031324 RepID=A0ABT5XQV8_9FLAO|nr:hypothetical protein [[Muricauda] okinawensis]MDF0708285.1 hypothetical protein [[Muricauda] okinawensis]